MAEIKYCVPITLKRQITGIDDIPGDLFDTLQELISRLTVIASMVNAGAPALRVIPIASVSTAVTGTLTAVTTVTTLTNFGTGYPAYIVAMAQSNLTATLANINNATPAS